MNLKLEDFESWLLEKNKNEIIGKGYVMERFPIVNWLKQSSNVEDQKYILLTRSGFILNYYSVNQPHWVNQFIAGINSEDVTVDQALSVINKIKLSTPFDKNSQ